jgi:uncharacterized protein YodC (DUF2158 family)
MAKQVKSESTDSWVSFKKQFPIGAKVKSSGGPIMTVEHHFEDKVDIGVIVGYSQRHHKIQGSWWVGKNVKMAYFAPEGLVLVKDDVEEKHS